MSVLKRSMCQAHFVIWHPLQPSTVVLIVVACGWVIPFGGVFPPGNDGVLTRKLFVSLRRRNVSMRSVPPPSLALMPR